MYKIFINNTRISHHQWAMVGIREMKECLDDNDYDPIQFSSDYSIRIYSSVCSYLDENNHWQSDGLTVSLKLSEYRSLISIRSDQKQTNVSFNAIQHI